MWLAEQAQRWARWTSAREPTRLTVVWLQQDGAWGWLMMDGLHLQTEDTFRSYENHTEWVKLFLDALPEQIHTHTHIYIYMKMRMRKINWFIWVIRAAKKKYLLAPGYVLVSFTQLLQSHWVKLLISILYYKTDWLFQWSTRNKINISIFGYPSLFSDKQVAVMSYLVIKQQLSSYNRKSVWKIREKGCLYEYEIF